MDSSSRVHEYSDELHAEKMDDLQIGEYGYKYRVLDGVMLPPFITPDRYHISRTLQTREDDICFISFPKSGSTWLSYILLFLVKNGEISTEHALTDNIHWVASSWPYPRSKDELDALPSPRIFKSHMPYHMAVGGIPVENPCRYIYIARNPKDVAVSYYYFEKEKTWAGNYSGPWEHWLEMFMKGQVQRGNWFDHVLSWWKYQDANNILFLKYEDLKRNFNHEIDKIAQFLHYPLTENLLNTIKGKTSFNNMREEEFSNLQEIGGMENFFRKGEIGSWQNLFTVRQSKQFDQLYAQRMAGTGLEFDFE